MADKIIGKFKCVSGKFVKEGVERKRWVEVGKWMQRPDGSIYALIYKHINFSAFLCPEGSDSVTATLFIEGEDAKASRKLQDTLIDDEPF